MKTTISLPVRPKRTGMPKSLPKLRGMFICPKPLRKSGFSLSNQKIAELFDQTEDDFAGEEFSSTAHRSTRPLLNDEEDFYKYGIE